MKSQFLKNLFLSIPLILTVIFFVLYINTTDKLDQLETRHNATVEKYEKEKQELIANNKKEERLPDDNKKLHNIALSNFYIKQMEKKGLSYPVRDIISDLKKHNELIPYEGILGGTMRFYGEKTTWVLTSKWVLAYFEDGHAAGYLLLEYNVSDNGEITWKRIASMLG